MIWSVYLVRLTVIIRKLAQVLVNSNKWIFKLQLQIFSLLICQRGLSVILFGLVAIFVINFILFFNSGAAVPGLTNIFSLKLALLRIQLATERFGSQVGDKALLICDSKLLWAVHWDDIAVVSSLSHRHRLRLALIDCSHVGPPRQWTLALVDWAR